MRFTTMLLGAVFVLGALAGCLDETGPAGSTAAERKEFPYYNAADGKYHFEFEHDGETVHFDWAPFQYGKVWNKGSGDLTVELPHGFFSVATNDGRQRLTPIHEAFSVAAGDRVDLLAPPGMTVVDLVLDGTTYTLDSAETNDYAMGTKQVVQGENILALHDFQEANFPHRMPGEQAYNDAIEYFATYFDDLGYDVEVDPYGLQDQTDVTGCASTPLGPICPESFSNVVATKLGTEEPEKIIFVSGGHFDMVPGTTHAAFDNTAGTVSTMELARFFANIDTRYTIKFGLWGGEENGILGSQFWVQSNPDARLNVVSYVNLDVAAMTWPAPIVNPDPILIAAGLDVPSLGIDGTTMDPYSQDLLGWMQNLQQNVFRFPDEHFLYEGILSGQVAGAAGVNAQSDHTPFAAAGIPAYFIFNGDALAGDNPISIHSERDTINNMTKYAYYGNEFDLDVAEWESEEIFQDARAIMAQSYENIVAFPLYHALYMDAGDYQTPGVQNLVGVPAL